MKIRNVFWGIISISIFFTACGSILQGNNNIVVEEEKEDMETKVSMTPEQEALLCKISIDEDRVKQGQLSDWQKEVLRQYDYVMEYLSGKYPSYTFHIVDCEPRNKLNQAYSTFNFTEESDKEGYYNLYLEIEDGKYSPEDNFYGHIIGPQYEAKLMELLKQENIPCNRVEARLSTVQGEVFNENMDIEEVITGNLRMSQAVDFYIDSDSVQDEPYQEVINKIRQLIEKRNIYGSFFITIYDAQNNDQTIFEGDFNTFK